MLVRQIFVFENVAQPRDRYATGTLEDDRICGCRCTSAEMYPERNVSQGCDGDMHQCFSQVGIMSGYEELMFLWCDRWQQSMWGSVFEARDGGDAKLHNVLRAREFQDNSSRSCGVLQWMKK
jgi:hypothetical protein